ncbi:ral guanine nucleotide dissociation stimulator-like isoform X2 [Neofelis nebulosa]|uniref:ral guanine nucleotide dissociation stimulator-like isoform X2 n=1 Tax=Neofelis nebulosa TaxID=61452 RepID=UPI00272AB221|nr:ral guanine nucleotide dissociation stimulator-like isoform X2 [Neofelis nebulosa]
MCSVISHLKFSSECQDPFSYSGHPGLRLATSHWGLGIWSAFWTPTLLLAIVLCLIPCPSCVLPQGTKVTPRNENENCVGWTIDAGLLKQRVEHLVPAFLGRDPTYVSTFLGTYPTFTTTQQVLEVLFMRAISSILGTWLDYYPEYFFQPPDFISLKALQEYVGVHMPGSELQRRARLLYSWWRKCEPNEPESLALAAALEPHPHVPRERAPAIPVVPTAASQPRLPEATSSPGAQRVRESETLTTASPPGQEVLPALADRQELEEPPAPLVAPEHEQPSAPAGGVTEGLEQPPAAAEQPASAPQQRLMSAAAPKDEFPDLVMAFVVIFVVCIEIFTVLMYCFISKT